MRTGDEPGAARSWEALRGVLVIAHPGHELRVHHWLERARPCVLVLTDGSGHTDHPRIAATTALLQQTGAAPGPLYGSLSDRDLYRAILSGDAERLIALAEEMARILDRLEADYVVGDAVEGFNPGHDVCRLILNAALVRAESIGGRRPKNFEFLLEGPHGDSTPKDCAESIVLRLDDDAYRRKLDAASAYPGIAADMSRLHENFGPDSLRVELLRPVRYGLEIGGRFRHPAFYEGYGEKQVAAGFYRDVIRFREHLAPLARRLSEFARGGVDCKPGPD
jgi:hypothetical protein